MSRRLFIAFRPIVFAILCAFGILAISAYLLAAGPSQLRSILPGLRPRRALAFSVGVNPRPLAPAGSGFTYQGRLDNSGAPANGQYDLTFTLYDAPSGGNQVGTPSVVTDTNQTLTDGLFTVSLDFGSSAFDGSARYLEIAVRTAGVGSFTTLSPRQPLTPAPYALFALKTQGYKGVKVVAQSGGDFTSVQSALDSITDNSTTNRYLVKVAAGTYTETVIMKPFVDIEGSGENVTKITFPGNAFGTTGTVVGADNAELRSLTVESAGGSGYAIAIFNSGVSPSLLHVTAAASGSTSFNAGVYNDTSSARMVDMTIVASQATVNTSTTYVHGVYNTNASPTMNNLTIFSNGSVFGTGQSIVDGVNNLNNSLPTMTAVNISVGSGTFGYGVSNSFSSPTIQDSTVFASGLTASYGIFDSSASGSFYVQVDNSSIQGLTSAIQSDSHYTAYVSSSKLTGNSIVSGGGTFVCASSQDGGYTPLPGNCVNNTGNVVYVAKSATKFTSIQTALNSITNNSSTNRYLVKIAPGTYTETVTMKPFVDIEGSGEGVTKITFGGSASLNTGTVLGASNAELRSLTVESSGGLTDSVAIYNSGASPSLLHVTANAFGSTVTNSANLGIFNTNVSSPIMKDVSATGTGGSTAEGVRNSTSSSPNMTDVTATASGGTSSLGIDNISNSSPTMNLVVASGSGGTTNYGMLNNSSAPKIQNSSFTGTGATSYGIYNAPAGSNFTLLIENSVITGATNSIRNDSHYTMRIGGSQLAGGPVLANSGPMTCGDTHDENNALLPNNCVNQSGNVVYVAKTGTAFTSIQAALDSITDNSTTNRYLVKIGPGTYSERVTMKPFIDIEGSGEDLTKITATGSPTQSLSATLNGASNAELRSLTVENTGGGLRFARGINNVSAGLNLLHVTITVSGASEENDGIVGNSMGSPSWNDVVVTVTGSQFCNGIIATTSAPTMVDVTVSATGSTNSSTGINLDGNAALTNVTVTASGGTGTTNWGIVSGTGNPTLDNVTVTASGGTIAYGVYNTGATSTIQNSNIKATSATSTYGVYNTSTASSLTVLIDNSSITGTTNTVRNETNFITRVGASKLAGGAVLPNGGTVTCAGVHDENYAFFSSSCP